MGLTGRGQTVSIEGTRVDPPNATSVDSSILGELSGKLGLGERVRQVENTGLAEGQQEEGLGPWTGGRQDRQAGEPNRLGTNPVLPIL